MRNEISTPISPIGHTCPMREVIARLRAPEKLWDHSAGTDLIPAEGGLYGWHFTAAPRADLDADRLLYVGISPGRATSKETLRSRIKYHFSGDAEGSTVRMTVGLLLGLPLHLRERTETKTFGPDGEAELSEWLVEHGRLCWHLHHEPWTIRPEVVAGADVPLNVQHNAEHPFAPVISALRARAIADARTRPRV